MPETLELLKQIGGLVIGVVMIGAAMFTVYIMEQRRHPPKNRE